MAIVKLHVHTCFKKKKKYCPLMNGGSIIIKLFQLQNDTDVEKTTTITSIHN